jgi:hypothetical protein
VPASFADVRLTTDDWLNAFAFHRVVEGDGAKHVAMISHGARRHAEFGNAFREGFYLNRTIEEAVIRVQMQMNEILIRHLLVFRGRCVRTFEPK